MPRAPLVFMPFAFEHWKAHDMDRRAKLRDLLDERRRRRDDPQRQEIQEERRARRQRIVDRLAALLGIAGGHFTGANWAGKATTIFILSAAAGILKWILTQ